MCWQELSGISGTETAKGNVIKKSKCSALLEARCPRCKEGRIFKYATFNYLRYHESFENCPCCGLRYEREPSFFTGAMYLSYFMNVGIILTIGLTIFYTDHNTDLWVYLAAIFPVVLLLMPVNFRYSRVVMLYLFGGV